MDFSDIMKQQLQMTMTENGCKALKTTNDYCVDLFGLIGSLRTANDERICELFESAYQENPEIATKIVFYSRDIRCGLGERKVFRTLIKYMAIKHPESLIYNIASIGETYGRWDDLYYLIDTPLENKMWKVMKERLEEDLHQMEHNGNVSLLAKWIKSPYASSEETRRLGKLTAYKLGYSVYAFKRVIKKLRKHIVITEAQMSTNKWSEIDYSSVPSGAMINYRKAFANHDEKRYCEYLDKVLHGEVPINSHTVYPYNIIEKVHSEDKTLEAMWNNMPNFVPSNTNAIVMADTSGSMSGRPLDTAIGLAIYFAERNVGAYHNMFMTFSTEPEIQEVKGDTLYKKVKNLKRANWAFNTNLEAALMEVLKLAVNRKIQKDEMVKSILIVSDMEIDDCDMTSINFYDEMKKRFEEKGYDIPNIVFWNVNSRQDLFHADARRKGVQLCSGQSTTIFKTLMNSIGMSPTEYMLSVINSDRYDSVVIKY